MTIEITDAEAQAFVFSQRLPDRIKQIILDMVEASEKPHHLQVRYTPGIHGPGTLTIEAEGENETDSRAAAVVG